jgi:hypothetical protein
MLYLIYLGGRLVATTTEESDANFYRQLPSFTVKEISDEDAA